MPGMVCGKCPTAGSDQCECTNAAMAICVAAIRMVIAAENFRLNGVLPVPYRDRRD